MKFADGLYFIASCLSLDIYPEREEELRYSMPKDDSDWELLVRISSDFLVLPAFYLSLERHALDAYLPSDLYDFLQEVLNLNRERNGQILLQIEELAGILKGERIDAIFIKGAAHLLKGIYRDKGERLLGDIDMLVEKSQLMQLTTTLRNSGYITETDFDGNTVSDIHYIPRFQHPERIAAIDLHCHITERPVTEILSMRDVFRDSVQIDDITDVRIPSDKHLLLYNFINTQLHDRAGYFGDIQLRQVYDLLLLAGITSASSLLKESGKYKRRSANYLALAAHMFNAWDHFQVKLGFAKRIYLFRMRNISIRGGLLFRIYRWIAYILFRFARNFLLLLRAIYVKEERVYVRQRIGNLSWYKEHIHSYTRHRNKYR